MLKIKNIYVLFIVFILILSPLFFLEKAKAGTIAAYNLNCDSTLYPLGSTAFCVTTDTTVGAICSSFLTIPGCIITLNPGGSSCACSALPTPTSSPSPSPTFSPSPTSSPTSTPTSAPTSVGGVSYYPTPINTTSWPDFFGNTTGWILGITVSIILLFLIIGGLVYITSAGQREKMELGKRIIVSALIGFFVIILSVSIIVELKKIL